MFRTCLLLSISVWFTAAPAAMAQTAAFDDLPTLFSGRTAAKNALWRENDLSLRFSSSKRVVIAEIPGPATVTMIHFALPQPLKLNRDVLLRIYWDGEKAPSVDCPLVDFFCDPAGVREEVNTALVNKRRAGTPTFPCRFASRPGWSWSTMARWSQATNCGSRCLATVTSCIAR